MNYQLFQNIVRFVLLFLVLSITKSMAADSSCSTTVPYSWSFTKTGDSVASVNVVNDGPTGTTVTGSDNFSGSFTIERNFTSPGGDWILVPGEVIPNTTNFTCTGTFDGLYANETLSMSLQGIGFPTHVNAVAGVTCLDVPAFSSVSHTSGPSSGGLTNQTRVSTSSVSDGQGINISGNVDADTLFGAGLPIIQEVSVFAQVYVSGSIDTQNKNIKYYKPDSTTCSDSNPDNDTCCTASCIDTDTDVKHCGACNNDCADKNGSYCNGQVKEERNYNICSGGNCEYTVISSLDCNSLDVHSSPGTPGKDYSCTGSPGSATCSYVTAITLTSFTVTTLQNEILIEWKTDMELDNAGFNIWRSEEVDGEYIKINDSLIQAEGSDYQYSFADNAVVKGKTYYYKLEDIDLNGVATLHGPVSARMSNNSFLPILQFLLRDR